MAERLIFKQRRAAEQLMKVAELAARRRDLGDMIQLHKLNGIWYRVTLAESPMPRVSVDGANDRRTVDYARV